jgi:hypothetical protein
MSIKNSKAELSGAFLDIPIVGIEESPESGLIFTNSGGVSVALRLYGINDSAFLEEDYEKHNNNMAEVIRKLDDREVSMQFIARKTKKRDIPDCSLSNLPPQLKERNRYLREELARTGAILDLEYYIIINTFASTKEESISDSIKRNIRSFKNLLSGTVNEDELDERFNEKSILGRIRKIKSTTTLLQEYMGATCDIQLLNKRECEELYFVLLNPSLSKSECPTFDSTESFRKQLMIKSGDVKEGEKSFNYGGYLHRTYTLNSVDNSLDIYGNSIRYLLDAPYEYVYSVHFRMLSSEESIKTTERKIMIVNIKNQTSSDSTSVQDTRDANHTQEIVSKFNEEGRVLTEVTATFTVLIPEGRFKKLCREGYMDHTEGIEHIDLNIKNNIFNKLSGSSWSGYSGQWTSFCYSLPACSSVQSVFTESLMETPSSIPYLLPLYMNQRNDITYYGFNHFFKDDGGILPFDVFDKKLPSWVYLIFGNMGMGKSVTINLLISMLYSSKLVSGKPPVIRGLDFGGQAGSYYKLAKLFGGQIFNFATAKKPSIQIFELSENQKYPTPAKIDSLYNLLIGMGLESFELKDRIIDFYERKFTFEGRMTAEIEYNIAYEVFKLNREELNTFLASSFLKAGECEPNMDYMNMLMGTIEVMLSPDPTKVVIDYERDGIINLIQALYRTTPNGFPYLLDFKNALVAIVGEQHVLTARISKWTRDGVFKMFDRDSDVDFSNDFLIFDMYGLESQKQLKQIYTLMITKLIEDDMYKKMDRQRMFLGDEIWAVMDTPAMVDMLYSFSKTSRKYKFAVALATQLPTDLFKAGETAGNNIISLATNYIFCGFTDINTINETAARYNLTDGTRESLGKMGIVTTKFGPVEKYSRFLMVSNRIDGRKINIYNSYLSPFEYQLNSSSKEDNAIIRYYSEVKGMDIMKTITKIIDRGHLGDDDLKIYLRSNNHIDAYDAIVADELKYLGKKQ